MTTISPALNGFLKGLLIVVVTAAAGFCADAANLAPIIGIPASMLVAGLASAIESHIKELSGRGLMGAVSVR